MTTNTPRQIRRSRALRGVLRVTKAVDWVRVNVEQFVAGLVSTGLTDLEVEQISIDIYESNMKSYKPEHGLFAWEEAALEYLPSPPARILIPGAGLGREAFALEDRGYEVWASEPTKSGAAALAARLGGRATVGSFEDLLSGPAWPPREVGATILGWGSLSHCLSSKRRARLLTRLAQRSDVIVVSVFDASAQQRAWRWGRRLASPAPGRGFVPYAGYFEPPSEAELREHSDRLDFDLFAIGKHPLAAYVLRRRQLRPLGSTSDVGL